MGCVRAMESTAKMVVWGQARQARRIDESEVGNLLQRPFQRSEPASDLSHNSWICGRADNPASELVVVMRETARVVCGARISSISGRGLHGMDSDGNV